MAYSVCITKPGNVAPQTEGEFYVKHVEFNGRQDEYHSEYRKLEKTLLFEYLKRKDASFPESLLAVSFNLTAMSQNESKNFCKDVLQRKRTIFCEGRQYRFLGHSETQLREKKCYFMHASEDDIHDLLARFGNFVKIPHVRKRAKKIGLLFEKFDHMLNLDEKDLKIERNLKGRKFAFTNSCGFMSSGFTIKFRSELRLGLANPEPSAVQVNCQGFHGMLVLKDLPINVPQVQFLKAMRKFDIPKEEMRQEIPFIGIVDYSRPHINGYLDARLIMSLVSRGVSTSHLEALQKGYLDVLKKMPNDPATADYFLSLTGRDATNTSEVGTRTRDVLNLQREEREKMIDHVFVENAAEEEPSVVRTRILVPKPRVVFGVCDPYNKLGKGECYFFPTLPDDEAGDFASEEQVVVVLYPCYHPGDIQVMKLSHNKLGYETLKNCLVLPVKGWRPHAFERSRVDLSASKFFVSWDQELVPKVKSVSPCSYAPTMKEKISEAWAKPLATPLANFYWFFKRDRERKKKSRAELIEYFANFTDDLPHRIDEIYLKQASTHDPSSKKCTQLSKMSYQAANLTVDRDVLTKRLAAGFEILEPEGTPLLGRENEGESENEQEDETARFLPGSRRMSAIRQAYKFLEECDERAKAFVRETTQEYVQN